jgi:hypothetical protein
MMKRLLPALLAAQVGLCVIALVAAFQVWASLGLLEVSVHARSVLTKSMLATVDHLVKQQTTPEKHVGEFRSTVLEASRIDSALVTLVANSRTVQAICSALLGVLLLASCTAAWMVWRARE